MRLGRRMSAIPGPIPPNRRKWLMYLAAVLYGSSVAGGTAGFMHQPHANALIRTENAITGTFLFPSVVVAAPALVPAWCLTRLLECGPPSDIIFDRKS